MCILMNYITNQPQIAYVLATYICLKCLKAHLIGEHWYPEAAPVRSEPHFSEVWRDHTKDEVVEGAAKKETALFLLVYQL